MDSQRKTSNSPIHLNDPFRQRIPHLLDFASLDLTGVVGNHITYPTPAIGDLYYQTLMTLSRGR
jgi:hypothetical protein